MPDGDWLDSFYAAAEFSGALRDCIHAFKYQRRDFLAEGLARHWVASGSIEPEDYDVIVPVPMAPLKSLVRGYNPAEEFAHCIAREHRRPLLRRVLSRRSLSGTQTNKNRVDRRVNARRGFRRHLMGGGSVAGLRVLLVDDVCTTGATLQACARLLKEAGAVRVFGAAIARDMLA